MAAKKKGLGRGLEALIGGSNAISKKEVSIVEAPMLAGSSADSKETAHDGDYRHIPVEFLQRGRFQPRRDMDPAKLEELSESIKAQGVMQPIVIRPISSTNYEIIAGERRWRASQLAGLDKVPCIIRDVPDEAAIAMALIENIQREDLNPIEEAVALQRLQDEFELTHQQVAEAVGKSRTTVTNLLRLNSLSSESKTMLEHGDLEMGHARAILTLDPLKQSEAARSIASRGLSVRQAEALVRRLQSEATAGPEDKIDPDVRQLQDSLSQRLGAPVLIQHSAKGRGKLVIKYTSLDELDGILAHIK
ncbi:MAG: chromosome partitioning protein ParB [Moraxellaceae bacterium]|nr:MAG: chromosome partitioning protein ParB [Moraxellaceae bacterium]